MQNLHILGDSFVSTNLWADVTNTYMGQYRFVSADGVGGTTLLQESARYALTPIYWNRLLLIMDGGLSDSTSDALTAIGQMVANNGNGNWLYVQPGLDPTWITGTANRIAWEATVAAISAAYPSSYVATLAAMQAANNGSTQDLSDISAPNNIWPSSLRGGDIHPNAAGDVVLGGIITAAIASRGW